MQYFLSTLAIFAISVCAKAQFYAEVTHFRPNSTFGEVMKPATSLEIGKSEFFSEGQFRTNFSLSFLVFKPRQDTMRTYSSVDDGGNVTVYPGYETVSRYFNLMLYGGVEWTPVERGKLHPFIGFDFLIGFNAYHGVSYNYGMNSDETDFAPLIGGRLKLGLDYELSDEWALMANIGSSGYLLLAPPSFGSGYNFNLGVKYQF